jgi:hypothetical protein
MFLAAVSESLGRAEHPVMILFQEDPGFTGRAYHSKLLWALEVLAWSPRYVGRVANLLAKLARLAPPQGKFANHPKHSLIGIFRLWLPQTNATLEERRRVLDHLRKTEPQISWELMLALLPGGPDVANPAPQPRWKDFSVEIPEIPTYRLIGEGANVLSGWIVEHAGLDATRWPDLVSVYPNLTTSGRDQAIEALLAASPSIKEDGVRLKIWDALRTLLHNHRGFPDAAWALPEEQLRGVAKAYAVFEPTSTVDRIAWLFSNAGADLPNPAVNDWKADEETSERLRTEAIEQLPQCGNHDLLFALVDAAKTPALVGFAFAEADRGIGEKDAVLSRALQSPSVRTTNFARGMIWSLYRKGGAPWMTNFVNSPQVACWQEDDIVTMLTLMPPSDQLWGLVTGFGKDIDARYWSRVNCFGIDPQSGNVAFAINRLLGANRARDAADLAGHHGTALPSSVVVEILKKAAHRPTAAGRADDSMFSHWVEELLQRLDKAGDIVESEIARLEWSYFQLLEHTKRSPIVLHKTLSCSASFFVEVLSAVYRPAGDAGTNETNEAETKAATAIATQAYGLLRSWRKIPGEVDGLIDFGLLSAWVEEARLLCAREGRSVVGDQHIGGMLASSPPDSDGIWPPRAVRDVLEVVQSRPLEDGVLIGSLNKRGATWRGLLDGGAQERSIASEYRKWSRATELEWPRTSALLERIARCFEEHGQREDQHAERTDWGL